MKYIFKKWKPNSVMNEALTEYQGIDIAMKLRKSTEVLNMKFEHELKDASVKDMKRFAIKEMHTQVSYPNSQKSVQSKLLNTRQLTRFN